MRDHTHPTMVNEQLNDMMDDIEQESAVDSSRNMASLCILRDYLINEDDKHQEITSALGSAGMAYFSDFDLGQMALHVAGDALKLPMFQFDESNRIMLNGVAMFTQKVTAFIESASLSPSSKGIRISASQGILSMGEITAMDTTQEFIQTPMVCQDNIDANIARCVQCLCHDKDFTNFIAAFGRLMRIVLSYELWGEVLRLSVDHHLGNTVIHESMHDTLQDITKNLVIIFGLRHEVKT